MFTDGFWYSIRILVLATLALAVGCGGTAEQGGSGQAVPAPKAPAPPPEAAPGSGGQAGPTGSAMIAGTVRYEGQVPPLKDVKMEADPGCAKKHSTPVKSEILVLGEGNTMANVFVRIKGGLPGGAYPPPAGPALLDQDGCRYIPHVLGVMQGQELTIKNSDGLLHNVHALPEVNKTFNMAMPASRSETSVRFSEEESMFKIKCDVHPWMGAYVAVLSHPFFDVTSTDGTFAIEKLPAGSYEIESWHEKLGVRTQSVEVAEGQQVRLDFTFTR